MTTAMKCLQHLGWAVAALAIGSSPAWANPFDHFLGWSADGSYYGRSTDNEDTAEEYHYLCRSNVVVGSTSWPTQIPRPEQGTACTSTANCDDDGNCVVNQKLLKALKNVIKKLLVLPPPAQKGPLGQRVRLKKLTLQLVARSAKPVTLGAIDADSDMVSRKDDFPLKIANVYWRADGGAVACEVAGYGSEVQVIALPQAAAPPPAQGLPIAAQPSTSMPASPAPTPPVTDR